MTKPKTWRSYQWNWDLWSISKIDKDPSCHQWLFHCLDHNVLVYSHIDHISHLPLSHITLIDKNVLVWSNMNIQLQASIQYAIEFSWNFKHFLLQLSFQAFWVQLIQYHIVFKYNGNWMLITSFFAHSMKLFRMRIALLFPFQTVSLLLIEMIRIQPIILSFIIGKYCHKSKVQPMFQCQMMVTHIVATVLLLNNTDHFTYDFDTNWWTDISVALDFGNVLIVIMIVAANIPLQLWFAIWFLHWLYN